jgi:hypothetical protein
MPIAHVLDVSVLGSMEFIGRDADPLLDEHSLGDWCWVGVPEQFADLLLYWLDFIFARALSAGHPRSAVLIEDVERHGSEPVIRVQCIAANVAGCDTGNRYTGRLCHLSFQSVQMRIDGLGFPVGIGENRVVDLGKDSFG